MLSLFPSSLCWQVQVQSHPRSHCKLIFSFWDNQYFWNTVVVKEYYLDITDKRGVCVQGGWGGRGCFSCGIRPVSPVFLQRIGHIIPLQSTGSGILNRDLPATGWTPGTLPFSIGCQATTAQNQTGLLKWVWFGPEHSWRLMLEFLASDGRVRDLVSPRLTLL